MPYKPPDAGTPQMLAERASAWQGYNGIDGSPLSQALRDFIGTKVFPQVAGPAAPAGLIGEDLNNWRASAGYRQVNYDAPYADSSWVYDDPSGASPYVTQMGAAAYTSPDGRFSIRGGANGWRVQDLSRGAGERTEGVYNPDGTFNHDMTGGGIMGYIRGILSVVGAAAGFGALGAAAGGGAAGLSSAGGEAAGYGATAVPAGTAGAGAGAGAAAGISYTAAGAPVFGVVDGAAPAGITYAAGGAPIFGVVDTSIPAGVTTAGGAPVFGVVDQGAAEASRATLATQGGAGGGAGGGGNGSGGTTGNGAATTGAAKAGAQALGASVLQDKLVGSLVSAGASSLLSSLFSPKPDMSAPSVAAVGEPRTADTKTKAVSEMPDPLAQSRARKRSLVEQLGRRGRASTVLTSPSGRLGN